MESSTSRSWLFELYLKGSLGFPFLLCSVLCLSLLNIILNLPSAHLPANVNFKHTRQSGQSGKLSRGQYALAFSVS